MGQSWFLHFGLHSSPEPLNTFKPDPISTSDMNNKTKAETVVYRGPQLSLES